MPLSLHCVRQNETQMFFFVISATKLGRFWWNLVHCSLNKFAAKSCQQFPPLLNNVSTLPCETWNVYRGHATIELLQKATPEFIGLRTLSVASKFARCESSWLQRVSAIAREGVQNTHHWSERTEAVTDWESENGVGSWIMSSLRQPFISGVVDSSRSVMRIFVRLLLQYFPHAVINWIQICRIWRPQLSCLNFKVSVTT